MSTALVQPQSHAGQVAQQAGDVAAAATEAVLLSGDINRLGPKEKVNYYLRVCDSLGLNPLTQPFEFITLSGKMRFYATKACTEQLRKINGVTVTIVSREVVEGCYIVTARATDKWGRSDESLGAVPIDNLKGEARSNAMMKAETKAKRRVTLSICGLGLLDESEADSIPGAIRVPAAAIEQARAEGPTTQALNQVADKLVADIRGDHHATADKGAPIHDLASHSVPASGADQPSPVPGEQSEPKGIQETLTPGAGGQAAVSSDTGEAAADGDVAMVRTQVGKLKWGAPKARSWLKATFGESSPTALTKQQAASALALLLAAGQGDDDAAYAAVYDRLKAQGQVL